MRFSVYDFMTVVCVCSISAATAKFHRMTADDAKHGDELMSLCKFLKFPGRGQRETPTMTRAGLHRLLCLIDTTRAAVAVRAEAFGLLERYLSGDASLGAEVEQNRAMGKAKSYAKFAEVVRKRMRDNDDNNDDDTDTAGYVYATKSAAFPGLLKIGKTEHMGRRLSSLNTGCAPAPHVVVALAPSLDRHRDEQLAHAFFAEHRREGEFFAVSEDAVVAYFGALAARASSGRP